MKVGEPTRRHFDERSFWKVFFYVCLTLPFVAPVFAFGWVVDSWLGRDKRRMERKVKYKTDWKLVYTP